MAYGTAPTSGGSGDLVTTDTIATIDGGGGTFGEAQIVKIGYGDSGDATVVKSTAGLPVSLNQSTFVFSTVNTSTAQLAPGQEFVGAIEAIPNQPAVSVLMSNDQAILLSVEQFIDAAGVYAAPKIYPNPSTIDASAGTSFSFPANGNYIRIRARNAGNATTTTFNLNTAYGNLMPATAKGNLPVSVNEIGGTAISGAVPVSVAQSVNINDPNSGYQYTNQAPRSTFITGDPNGPLAGVNVLEELVQGNFQLPVTTPDIKKGADGGLMLSDGVVFISSTNVAGSIQVPFMIVDCTGYSYASIRLESGGGTNGVAFSNTAANGSWSAGTNIIPLGTNFLPSSAGGPLLVPVVSKYIGIYCATNTSGPQVVSVLLKYGNVPVGSVYLNAAGNAIGSVSVSSLPALPTGANTIGNVNVLSVSAGTNAIGDVGLQYRASSTGAATISKFTAAATTNAASIKASAGRVVGWSLVNTTAAIKVFRFFNKASAPTMGTDSPAFVVYLAANGRSDVQLPVGIAFGTGIAIACTGAIADLDTTATAANDVLGAIFYA